MGKLLEYVVLLSHLSLILGAQQYKGTSPSGNYDRKIQENYTLSLKELFPKDQNELFNKKVLPLGFPDRRRSHPSRTSTRPQMTKSVGLQAYASKDPIPKTRRRNPPEQWRNRHEIPLKKNLFPPFSQNLPSGKSVKSTYSPDLQGKGSDPKSRRLPLDYTSYGQGNSFGYKHNGGGGFDGNSYYRKQNGRTGRFNNLRHSPKVCDPCNSVPWVPLLKVPDSYRQQRTHITEILPTPNLDLNLDFHAFASDTHNILVPPLPLAPPIEPIYDGTISSSFGLPIGNIPTGHGLLAPINHLAAKFNRYGANSIDYSNSLKFFPTQSLLETNTFTQLSPVPIVPIHDATQFYQYGSSLTNLIPPTTKTVDVSNVVLTISEDSSEKHNSDSTKLHKQDLKSGASSVVGFQSNNAYAEQYPPLINQIPNHNLGKLEIVKSIPLAEFTSTGNLPLPGLQVPSINPPPQFTDAIFHPPKPNHHAQKETNQNSNSYTDVNFLVPPPLKRVESDTTFNTSKSGVLPFMNPPKKGDLEFADSVKSSTVPKPLTSSSLSWLFSDHSVPSTTPKLADSASHQFNQEIQEIASIVNNELRSVSPHPFHASSPGSENSDSSKSKKIQIIIPYTTKNKNGYDNNALESVQHEVFQPPVSVSTHENNSSHDSANFALPPLPGRDHHHLFEGNRDRKVIDGTQAHLTFKTEKESRPESYLDNDRKYLADMHHIIASNIRELLREEIEKSQNDQNYPLQNNIDNWTALEYSNHKTVGEKAPKEIINQALAVTSIPGTSISHLLLPSKKIPNEYFITTPLPDYDEPSRPVYNATNSSVDSRPFTAKPYATTNLYVPTRNFREESRQSKITTENVSTGSLSNHEQTYTEITRERVNNWGRLKENLVLPEAKARTRNVEDTATTSWGNRLFASSVGNEKIQIVTPASSTTTHNGNYTTHTYRRTTRQVHSTEKPTTKTTTTTTTTTTKKVGIEKSGTKVNSISVNATLIQRNSTKLEKVSNATTYLRYVDASSQRQNKTRELKVVTTTEVVKENISSNSSGGGGSGDGVNGSLPFDLTSEELLNLSKVNISGQFSINDIFPFRNKELPWEMNSNGTQQNFLNGRQRKSLIKQVKALKEKTRNADSS